mmetsp:Transcript_25160/g.74353  ORF Transcript_25160/g.74353 Transcript_25160/m.74353 type:complete len:204 (+) Transcript_25160:221-832(+)
MLRPSHGCRRTRGIRCQTPSSRRRCARSGRRRRRRSAAQPSWSDSWRRLRKRQRRCRQRQPTLTCWKSATGMTTTTTSSSCAATWTSATRCSTRLTSRASGCSYCETRTSSMTRSKSGMMARLAPSAASGWAAQATRQWSGRRPTRHGARRCCCSTPWRRRVASRFRASCSPWAATHASRTSKQRTTSSARSTSFGATSTTAQ